MTARSCETQSNHRRRGRRWLDSVQPNVPGRSCEKFQHFTFGWHTMQVTEPAQSTLRQGDRDGALFSLDVS